jgi:hypothetical protein
MAKVALEISTSTKMPAAYAVCCAVAAARSRRRLMTPIARRNPIRQDSAVWMKNGGSSLLPGKRSAVNVRAVKPM